MSKYETKILTTPYGKPDAYHALAMPVYHTAAYEFDSAEDMEAAFCGRSAEHAYSRISNPLPYNIWKEGASHNWRRKRNGPQQWNGCHKLCTDRHNKDWMQHCNVPTSVWQHVVIYD